MQMNLTPKDLIEIINASKGAVSSLKLTKSSVEVVFSSKPIETISSATENPIPVENNVDGEIKVHEIVFTPEKSPVVDDEEELLEDLRISDPLKFEELIANKELVDVEDNSGS